MPEKDKIYILHVIIIALLFPLANQPCGRDCSFGCAMINGTEQCFCPTGYELSTPNGIECSG